MKAWVSVSRINTTVKFPKTSVLHRNPKSVSYSDLVLRDVGINRRVKDLTFKRTASISLFKM